MNDQTQMMNQQHQMVNQAPPQQQQQPPQPQMLSNPAQMSYGQWAQQPPPHSMSMSMAPPNAAAVMNNVMKFPPMNPMFPKSGRSWKGKKPMDKRSRKDAKINNNNNVVKGGLNVGVGGGIGLVYQPPTLYELEQQNRLKARRFYHPKKKFNRMGPYAHAPRNTTSYIIRAKKAGGIASLVSPCPVTPAVLPTPVFSPSREALVDMAKEEWGVDGYGSMKGLIRLRSPGHDEGVDEYEEEEEGGGGGSSESDVEEHVEVERRLDHDLSRFEMIYPNSGVDFHNVLENRVDDQDTHIAQLEEENLILKERLYLMERELGEMRRRLLCLERQNQVVEDINEEVVENVSENESEGIRHDGLLGHKGNEEVDYVPRNGAGSDETLQNELKDLAVKEDFQGEDAMESELKENVVENRLVNDGLVFNVTVASKGGEHVQKSAGEGQQLSGDDKDIASADGTSHEECQPVQDVCMGNENDMSEKCAVDGTGADLRKQEVVCEGQTEGCTSAMGNEAA